MMAKLCPKIILEGTRLTFKTEIALALNEHPGIVGPRKYRYHSPLISAEWCAFTNFPWGRGLINFEQREEERAMETYRTWLHLFELLPYYSWIIDRFHISTKLYQKQVYGREYDFSRMEKSLKKLGFRIVFCTRKAESFQDALHERLKVTGNPDQYRDLDLFVGEQEKYRELINQSVLPKFEVDVSHNRISQVTDEIADWLERTGGLWAK
ncbi:MAG: hypothetical protein JXL67_04460 [Calditrichaeota bacterium]|nr:hypothetical protein [Calditrichota bacterium]